MIPEHVPVLIITCCALHNICELHGAEFNSDCLFDDCVTNTAISEDENSGARCTNRNTAPSAINIRSALVQYFDQ